MKPPTSMVVLAIAASVVACDRSSEKQAGKMAKATAIVEQKKDQALQQLEQGDGRAAARALAESQEAGENAAREGADFVNAVSREQNRYHALLAKEIAWLDRRLAEREHNARTTTGSLRAEKEAEITAGREWQARLREDLELVDKLAPETDWSALKTRVERDLDENRPAAIPRWYEKSYGI